MKAFCAICLNRGPALRPRQLEPRGSVFILCERCDCSEPQTVVSQPPRFHVAPRRGGGWQRAKYQPLDVTEQDTAFRILRCVARHDWISSMEICDQLGIAGTSGDRRPHNNYSVRLSKLRRDGFLERRHVLELPEYRITDLGRARLENWLRCAVEQKASIAA